MSATTDLNDQENACVVEQTTVIFETSLTARRKRMEIRRFRRLSCSPSPSRGLSSVQQGAFKRSRLLRTCSVCYSNDADGESDNCGTLKPLDGRVNCPSKLVAELKSSQAIGESYTLSERDVLGGIRTALERSKSFPSECFNTSRCILHIRKANQDCDIMDGKSNFSTIFCEESAESTVKETESAGICSTDPVSTKVSQHTASAGNVLATELNADNVDMDSKQEGTVPREENRSESSMLDAHMPDLPAGGVHSDGIMSSGFTSGATGIELQGLGKCPLSAKVLVCGRRREMEDTAVIAPHFTQIPVVNGIEGYCDLHFFAVYDGHGGSQASNFCANRLHHALLEELARSEVSENMGNDSEWKRVMTSVFLKMDQEVGGICPNGACENIDSTATCCMNAVAPENVGTTAVVAVVSPSRMVIANCGDSRAVLSRGGVAIPVSRDHKPEREDETSRIEAAGGRVIYWDGYRVAGLLGVSRALGDRYLKQYVISEPDVLCLPRADDDECLILASDGLWDVVSNETACDVARSCLALARRRHEGRRSASGEDTACAQVAALLVKLANGRGSKDNISVVVIELKPRRL